MHVCCDFSSRCALPLSCPRMRAACVLKVCLKQVCLLAHYLFSVHRHSAHFSLFTSLCFSHTFFSAYLPHLRRYLRRVLRHPVYIDPCWNAGASNFGVPEGAAASYWDECWTHWNQNRKWILVERFSVENVPEINCFFLFETMVFFVEIAWLAG